MTEIRDPQAQLEKSRYLLYFSTGPLSADQARALSDWTNLRASLVNHFGNALDFELVGTTVRPSTKEFIALCEVRGTPLIAIVNPIVQIVLLVTAGVILLAFIKAVLVPLSASVGTGVAAVGDGLKAVGEGLKSATAQAGTGLKYGLPALGVAAAVLLVLNVFGVLALTRARR